MAISLKSFEEKCFDEFKKSQVKADVFEGPIGQNIICVPVRNQAQFEYCRANGIEVFEKIFRMNGFERHIYCFYITFEQAVKAAL